MHVVQGMHARKAKMAELADAFLALPGGYGTFEELFEIITWAQLGIHRKPIGLLNVAGYFDPLLMLIEGAVEQGFIRPAHRELFVTRQQPEEILAALPLHHMPEISKWIGPDEA
jgi:uncharacterized protein (TIGR00730 family)